MFYALYIIITVVSSNTSQDYNNALNLIDLRGYEEAIEMLKEISPHDTLLGRLNILAGRYSDALSCNLSSYQRGWVYQKLGRYEEAIQSYLGVKGELHMDAMYRSGECASMMGDTSSAIKYFKEADDFLDSEKRLAISYQAEQKYIEALLIWDEIDDAESLYRRAEIHELVEGKGDSLYYSLINRFPGSSYALLALGKVKVSEEKMADVLYKNKHYGEALKYIPLSDHSRRAVSLEGTGRYLEAAEEYRSAGNHIRAAASLMQAGLYKESIDEYLLSESDEGLFNAGLLYESLGMIDKAIDAYGRITSSYIEIANLRRALLFLEESHIDSAKACLERTSYNSRNYWLFKITGDTVYESCIRDKASLSYYSYLLDHNICTCDTPPEKWIVSFCDSVYNLTRGDRKKLDRAKIFLRYGIVEDAKRELSLIKEENPLFRYRLALLANQGGLDELAYWYASNLVKEGKPPYPLELMYLAYPLYHLPKVLKYEEVYPLLFMSLIMAESHFYKEAVSPSNAIGLTQVLPSTGEGIARELGINPFNPESLNEPETSIRFGLNYFNYCLNRFDGVPEYALAAYNGGPSRVSKWMRNIPLDMWVELIPREQTRLYVKKVMASYNVYRQLYKDLEVEGLKYPKDS